MGLTVAAILNALASGSVKLENWEGDHAGIDLTDIKGVISGVAPVHLKFDFKESGTAKKLEGQRPLAGGGTHVVKLDGAAVPGARITFKPIVKGLKPRLSVKFIVKKSPEERYRFDADAKGLIPGFP
jgi:hypothetical protein